MKRGIFAFLIFALLFISLSYAEDYSSQTNSGVSFDMKSAPSNSQYSSAAGIPSDAFEMDVLRIEYSNLDYYNKSGFILQLNTSSMKVKGKSVKRLFIIPGENKIFYGTGANFGSVAIQRQDKSPRGRDLSEATSQITSIEIMGRTFLLSQVPDISTFFTADTEARKGQAYRIVAFARRGMHLKPMAVVVNGAKVFTNEIYLVPKSENKEAEIYYLDNGRLLKKVSLKKPASVIVFSLGRVSEVECKDSDGGLKPEEKGTVRGPYLAKTLIKGEWEDYCKSDKELVEYRCEEGKVRFNVVVCPSGCEDGRCEQLPYCIDSDGSMQYSSLPERYDHYVKGTLHLYVSSESGKVYKRMSDKCSGNKTAVEEMKCSNDVAKPYEVEEIECGEGYICSAGKCLRSEESETQAGGCTSDSDCGSLEVCDEGECKSVECKTDNDCTEGNKCEDNKCVEKKKTYDFQSRIDRLMDLKDRILALEKEISKKPEKPEGGKGFFYWIGEKILGLGSSAKAPVVELNTNKEPPNSETNEQARKAQEEYGVGGTGAGNLKQFVGVIDEAVIAEKSKGGGDMGDLAPGRTDLYQGGAASQPSVRQNTQPIIGITFARSGSMLSNLFKNLVQ